MSVIAEQVTPAFRPLTFTKRYAVVSPLATSDGVSENELMVLCLP
jgi:hypothetical protein